MFGFKDEIYMIVLFFFLQQIEMSKQNKSLNV